MTLRRFALGSLLAASLLAGCATPPTPATPPAPPGTPASPPSPPTASDPQPPLRVTLFALNDFHGYLKPPAGGVRVPDPANPQQRINVPAGGVAAMATMLAELRAQNPNHAFVAAGDLVGASPLLSALFHDEPTIEAFNRLGLDAAAMGNHELDHGSTELLRLQNGGCHPADGCKGPARFAGAAFPYLAANTVVQATGTTLFAPYTVKRFEGVPVAFIGLTLKNTPGVVSPAGVAGLRFLDEADTVNALVPELRRQGIEAIVLLLHEGGIPTGEYNECPGISGEIVDIVKRLDKAVDAVISGHTHRAYNCVIDGRPVTSALSYGLLMTRLDLVLDRRTRDVVSARADNLIVDTARYAPDAQLAAHVAAYERLAQPLARRPVTTLAAPFPTRVDANGESPLGQLIADAQLDATREAGAQIALMNPGGVRAPLGSEAQLAIAYEDVFAVQPFSNPLVTLTLSGAQLQTLLEQPLGRSGTPRPLFVSRSLAYRWDGTRPAGQRIVPGSLTIDGRPVLPDQAVRITANAFVADGGDDNSVLRQGRDRRVGALDVDALEAYLKAHPGLAPDGRPRVVRLDAVQRAEPAGALPRVAPVAAQRPAVP